STSRSTPRNAVTLASPEPYTFHRPAARTAARTGASRPSASCSGVIALSVVVTVSPSSLHIGSLCRTHRGSRDPPWRQSGGGAGYRILDGGRSGFGVRVSPHPHLTPTRGALGLPVRGRAYSYAMACSTS